MAIAPLTLFAARKGHTVEVRVPGPRLCVGVRIRLTLEDTPTQRRECVRELVCRAGGTQRVPLPPVRARQRAAETHTAQRRGKTPGINPGARGAVFRLIPSAEFSDTPTQSRGRGTQRGMPRGVAAALVLMLCLGCEGRQSTAQRVEKAYKSAGMEPVAVYPLGGRITVDSGPPVAKSETSGFVAIAYDVAKSEAPARSNPRAFVKSDGSFELPPLPPGKYVMLFAQLGHNSRLGFFGRDGLENLYNDPDVNSKKPDFVIDHRPPGKTDYTFNLSVAGETPPAAPGPKAFVGTVPRGK
jgi:hypothetical protein